jgi:hypothetical protein
MLDWLKSLFKPPEPAGQPQTIQAFGSSDKPITSSGVTSDQDGWRIEFQDGQSVPLFKVPDPGVEQCMLTYRAKIKSENLEGRAYLEMWCRLPGRGEFFSKGLHRPVQGTTDWASYEIPFYLKKGQCPDLVKLNVTAEGRGTLWIKDIELLQTPLK